jgi:hypothetical protein
MNPFLRNCHNTMNLLSLLCFFVAGKLASQSNLVPNFSFEESDTACITPANSMVNHLLYWKQGNAGSMDLYTECFSGAGGVPVNIVGIQTAKSGTRYIGLIAYYEDTIAREYAQVKLYSSLEAGKVLCRFLV